MKPINIFVAYAPEDEEYREKMRKHLSVLRERGFINEFCISEITPGTDADLSTRTLMNKSQIILLLISADFLASEECRRFEDLAFSMQMKNDAVILPVLLRSCLYDESYNKLQILPDNKKPISDKKAWGNEDEAFSNVTERIKQLVIKLREGEPSAQSFSGTNQQEAKKSKKKFPVAAIAAIGLLLSVVIFWQPWSSNSSNSNTTSNKNSTPTTTVKTPEPAKSILIPKLTGLSYADAINNLKALGIDAVNKTEIADCDKKPGTVISQRPANGTNHTAGQSVELQIVGNPKLIKAPKIRGKGELKVLKGRGRYTQNAWALKNTNVRFSLGGNACTEGKITVRHPLGGEKIHYLKAGQEGTNTRLFGLGAIDIIFTGSDPSAVLNVMIW